jgi:hypothetical protein
MRDRKRIIVYGSYGEKLLADYYSNHFQSSINIPPFLFFWLTVFYVQLNRPLSPKKSLAPAIVGKTKLGNGRVMHHPRLTHG